MIHDKKQTTVDWIEQEMLKPNLSMKEILQKAKEMEKEQIIKAHSIQYNYSYSQIDPKKITGEQYYEQTYGGNK
jgi:DNA polymerase III alpha subunit (gram-positive type)